MKIIYSLVLILFIVTFVIFGIPRKINNYDLFTGYAEKGQYNKIEDVIFEKRNKHSSIYQFAIRVLLEHEEDSNAKQLILKLIDHNFKEDIVFSIVEEIKDIEFKKKFLIKFSNSKNKEVAMEAKRYLLEEFGVGEKSK